MDQTNALSAPEPLSTLHNTESFDCGKEPLNAFLQLHALDKQKAKLSRTYVVADNQKVVGYYTLAHASVRQDQAPAKLARGMPREIPAILMARFAIDISRQGRGLGRSLFVDAIIRTWAVMENGPAPVRFFIVDAIDAEARRFYERFDMIARPDDGAPTYPLRLFLPYKTIESVVAIR